MSPVNFCGNPLTKLSKSDVPKVASKITSDMKPFPELVEKTVKQEKMGIRQQAQKAEQGYVSPFAPYQKSVLADVNENFATAAAKNEYPPTPFN